MREIEQRTTTFTGLCVLFCDIVLPPLARNQAIDKHEMSECHSLIPISKTFFALRGLQSTCRTPKLVTHHNGSSLRSALLVIIPRSLSSVLVDTVTVAVLLFFVDFSWTRCLVAVDRACKPFGQTLVRRNTFVS